MSVLLHKGETFTDEPVDTCLSIDYHYMDYDNNSNSKNDFTLNKVLHCCQCYHR